jgi:hypothetical protein
MDPEVTARTSGAAESTSVDVELTVLMPCLDEAETLERCIRKAQGFIRAKAIEGEIVVADNGSTDGSPAIAEQCGARLVSVATRGYGAALRGGIEAARGRYIIMADADDSYDFSALEPFLDKLRAGCDLVMGNRFKGGVAPGAMPPLHRYFGNPLLTVVGRLFFRSPCGDFHCGLRGFTAEAARRMDLQTTGMEFASEMVVKATLLKMRIAEVPTTLSPAGRSRPPHLRSWRDGWRHLRFLLLYSPRWLFLYPGLVLVIAGLVVGLLILPGPLKIGDIVLDQHTLVYAAASVIVGFQAMVFAVFTKVFAVTNGLIPPDPRLERAFRHVTLETGLIVGAITFALGLGGTIFALIYWGRRSFGSLDPEVTMRIVVPSALFLTLGLQVLLASFFLSVLGLQRGRASIHERDVLN